MQDSTEEIKWHLNVTSATQLLSKCIGYPVAEHEFGVDDNIFKVEGLRSQ